MTRALRVMGQALVLLAFMVVVGFFSAAPPYRHMQQNQALLRVSFVHGGDRETECRKRTRKEVAEMAANMRKALDCPRRRVPLRFEIALDGALLHAATLPPTGLAGDGPSRIYERFVVPAGRHVLDLRLRDSRRFEGFDHSAQKVVELSPGATIAVGFRKNDGGFVLR